MTISTAADHEAKTRQQERDGAMFPRGVKQMLGFIYAMEGEVSRHRSWHAKMLDLREAMDRGYIHPVSLYQINLSGLDPIMINGECAGLRHQVEESLAGHHLDAVLAKFGRDDLPRTGAAVARIAEVVKESLTTGRRRRQRSSDYCIDLVWSAVCCKALYDRRYNTTAISMRHQVWQRVVWGDCDHAKRIVESIVASAYQIVNEMFSDGEVLPIKSNAGIS